MTPFLSACIVIAMSIMLVALLLSLVRVVIGPMAGDRIVAVDLFGVQAVAFIALLSLYVGQEVFLDAAIALALVAFFSTVAYARFLEHKATLHKKAKAPKQETAT
ncbi:monovalent cation/H+ antiporter complex subunit F [Niveispirillum sp.]|uniref:monovalent cation/H+ antiporter complex subunit F n=1 Tax=Niveispirillum sp. TaxID=1917217 RepID=UPI001B773591|nr:monovalent cation/H+ antiporter complex subunit F [Niveispirillum sp.]MBP7340396.1 cation transporter [Niveispirillum sp.]